MNKDYAKKLIEKALAYEAKASKSKRNLIETLKKLVNEMGGNEAVWFEADGIFYDYCTGRGLNVNGVRVKDNSLQISVECSLYESGYTWCDHDSDGETDFETLIEILNDKIDNESSYIRNKMVAEIRNGLTVIGVEEYCWSDLDLGWSPILQEDKFDSNNTYVLDWIEMDGVSGSNGWTNGYWSWDELSIEIIQQIYDNFRD